MVNRVFRTRLQRLTDLTTEELDALCALASDRWTVPMGHRLFAEGDRPQQLHIVVDGWAARVKSLPDGARHFTGLLVTGDLCDVDGLFVASYDYGVIALTQCSVVTIDRLVLLALCEAQPRIARVLTWLGFLDNALLNELSVSLARRSARERLAHCFCELMVRLKAIGCARDDGFDLPLSQEKLADALGLTPVHVNRTLRQLRIDGLVSTVGQRLLVPDWDALMREARFLPAYLHLEGMREDAV